MLPALWAEQHKYLHYIKDIYKFKKDGPDILFKFTIPLLVSRILWIFWPCSYKINLCLRDWT